MSIRPQEQFVSAARVEFVWHLNEATVAIVANADGIVSIHVEPDVVSWEWPSLRLAALCSWVRRRMASAEMRYALKAQGNDSDPFLALPRPGRRGRPDIDYAVLAMKYVEACVATSGRPMPLLEKQNPGFTTGTMREILHAARYRGLLTESKPGRAGGALTPKALNLLREYAVTR